MHHLFDESCKKFIVTRSTIVLSCYTVEFRRNTLQLGKVIICGTCILLVTNLGVRDGMGEWGH